MKNIYFLLLTFLVLSFSSGVMAKKNNLHLIDKADNGFAIYRTSKPSAADMREFCRLGIQEMMVLSGNAEENEIKLQKECPTLKVVYNEEQSSHIPVTASFLKSFDEWVGKAQAEGKKIAFRCNCGCHRTGRLAAYYQMKYQGITAEDAKIILKEHGKYMLLFQHVYPQVFALEDYIQGRPCSVPEKSCVKLE